MRIHGRMLQPPCLRSAGTVVSRGSPGKWPRPELWRRWQMAEAGCELDPGGAGCRLVCCSAGESVHRAGARRSQGGCDLRGVVPTRSAHRSGSGRDEHQLVLGVAGGLSSSWCSTFPGVLDILWERDLRGVAHLRYACGLGQAVAGCRPASSRSMALSTMPYRGTNSMMQTTTLVA